MLNANFQCQCSMPMFNANVECQCWMPMFNANVGCQCWMSMLNANVQCQCSMPMLHVDIECGCWIINLNVNVGCQCWMPMLKSQIMGPPQIPKSAKMTRNGSRMVARSWESGHMNPTAVPEPWGQVYPTQCFFSCSVERWTDQPCSVVRVNGLNIS